MSHPLRDSLELIRTVKPEAGQSALEGEILAEKAASLGLAERRVIKAMADVKVKTADNEGALAFAREAVWAYFVQRELNGFRKHQDVIRDLGITGEVLRGLGAIGVRRAADE